mmetsp:Transcript_32387/g.44913  ORF Transcript_32387/g.44913 Transcript_32387/m.44913 type:complete len:397 (-) Transcript_32387:69-1259(-)|eukprot:CAMPEP_0196581810 /NCGR_PEP_ID=MMETSP1081-20130531/35774_1 /TAXON_ID=36882 /ORGANISM="Pyramimonas amylifera, Strain CCMP720" /LENGTH=396 /DNA_ID=CAMNT_0041902177 /DNA_START=389 /DNA_END=1579 /DNA_ORIENTATION=+
MSGVKNTQQGAVLTPVEAAQVQALLRSALEKLSLSSVITVDVDEQAAELSRSVGDEISNVIQEQRQLEQRFEVLISQRGILRAMPNKTKYKENQKELHDVANQLRTSMKVLCRNLKENPNVAGNMLKVQTERMQLSTLLSTCVVELEDCWYDTLTKTVEDEEARERQVAQTIERERAATQAVKQLKVQLKEEKHAHDDDVMAKKELLSTLKDELKDVKATTSTTFKYQEKEFSAGSQCGRRVQSNHIQALEDEIERLRNLIDIEKQVHAASAEFLKKKQKSMQEEGLAWSAKLDSDVKTKEHEMATLVAEHNRDLMKLKEVKAKYQQAFADREVRLDEDRKKQEAESAQAVDAVRRGNAASMIQALWRGHKVRAAMNPSKAKGGKKGGGKKGKKKK